MDRRGITFIFFLLPLLFFAGCESVIRLDQGIEVNALGSELVQHARGFNIQEKVGGYEVTIFSPWKPTDTLKHFFVIQQGSHADSKAEKSLLLQAPLHRLIALSATQWGPLLRLNAANDVVGVSEGRFITNQHMRQLLSEGKVLDVAGDGRYDVEKMITLGADAVLYSPDPTGIPTDLAHTGLTLIPWTDYFETHPLGRAEWIKLLGILTGKQQEATAMFEQISRQYLDLKQLAATAVNRPSVFADKAFAGQWYVPGGQSYMATMLTDAGADYVFADLNGTASVPLDPETIFSKAANADFWRIAQAAPNGYTYQDLEAENALHAGFKAFKNHKVVFCNTDATAYFENGALDPHLILADFVAVFHPELLPNHKAVYYHLLMP